MDIVGPSFQTLVVPEQTQSSPHETLRLEWPLTTLRQFAFNGCLFKMETGRRAPHGEGHYLFRIPDIAEFRQNLETHIDHLKRSRRMKTRSAVCYRPLPPSIPPPPPPLSSVSKPYVNIPTILPTPTLNRSWTNLLQPTGEMDKGLNDLENDDNDWLVELATPPPPPPISAPLLTQDTLPIRDEQSKMHRVGTYENVRSVLRSNEKCPNYQQSPIVVSSSSKPERSPKADSTINYAMLDFQEPKVHRGNSRTQSIGSPQRRSYKRPVLPPAKSCSSERPTRSSVSQTIRRLARSVEARLNMTEVENRVQQSTQTGSSNGGNYVDICPLQTLAINELLRSTL
ncbi:unnamed protein product [Rodentolepis nana]|uniref:IRS-type PTB domain-containing protein n=1 Tax=Rodentolepis nana TaxID=102285 RepID=A0A0R3T8V2_RODNA|nr:unnamed protein product [Rodentolepis nana]